MAERSVIGESKSGNAMVDPQLWHACAGSQVQVPQVGSSVIYFPQGHGEHASSPPEIPKGFSSSSTIPCRVLSVKFLADAETDEVYARIGLLPECAEATMNPAYDCSSTPMLAAFNPSKAASFAKTLTQSDANNGGGFSVPRFCAETIFPRLDYSKDPPVQLVRAKDVHGNEWKFRHIYRGTPRRHLLTTGWSNFVNQKKLVAGDAIIFLREANGVLCVGVRRSTKTMGARQTSLSWHQLSSMTAPSVERPSTFADVNSVQEPYRFLDNGQCLSSLSRLRQDISMPRHSFARNQGRVTSNSVLEAATLAAAGKAFEVVFYPMSTVSEFCVSAQLVRASLQRRWAMGMRFKMAMETEDASRISWFMGTVSKVQEAEPLLWPNSPWKMLQVAWDEPDLLQGITRVSPWQVEVVPPIQWPPLSLSKKKVRLSQPSDFALDGPDYACMASSTVNGEILGLINPWHGQVDSIPAGMQGARHDRNSGLLFQAPLFPSTKLFVNNAYQQREVSLMGGMMASTDSKPSVHAFFQHGCDKTQSSRLKSLVCGNNSQSQISASVASDTEETSSGKTTTFMLFGKTINASQSHNEQQPQASPDSPRHDAITDYFKSQASDNIYQLLTDQGTLSHHPVKMELYLLDGHEITASGTDIAKTLKCSQQHENQLHRISLNNGPYDCKVFCENEDVVRTLDLSLFLSYEQLHEALETLLGAKKSEFLNRIVCVDSMGFSKPIGHEPYRDFMQTVKKLKISTESSSESTEK